jgi:hypothetical protein
MSTQNLKIAAHLMRGRTITPVEALEIAGCFRLSERIRELERLGWNIKRGWVKTHGGARVRSYKWIPRAQQ